MRLRGPRNPQQVMQLSEGNQDAGSEREAEKCGFGYEIQELAQAQRPQGHADQSHQQGEEKEDPQEFRMLCEG